MASLRIILCKDRALKTTDISDGMGRIVVGVNFNLDGDGATLQKEKHNLNLDPDCDVS